MNMIFDSKSNFYMSIIDSVISLIRGDYDAIKPEFFQLLKVDPAMIKDIKELLHTFKGVMGSTHKYEMIINQ